MMLWGPEQISNLASAVKNSVPLMMTAPIGSTNKWFMLECVRLKAVWMSLDDCC